MKVNGCMEKDMDKVLFVGKIQINLNSVNTLKEHLVVIV